MFKRRYVTTEIVGGLGNQLFGLAAGMFLAQKLNAPVKLDLSMIGKGGTDHGKSILNFDLPNTIKIKSSRWSIFPLDILRRVNNKISRRFKRYSGFLSNLTQIYTSSELGLESKFIEINEPKYIKGYFQSYIYVDAVRDSFMSIANISKTSEWFNRTLDEMHEAQPYVLHIRRGDYKTLINDFGLLSIEYYQRAVSALPGYHENAPIWIFTDSPKDVINEIQGTSFQNARVIMPLPETPVNESLILMSKAKYLVIGNSTFSWWAGYLNANQANIVAPKKWFKGREDPRELLPPQWILAESIWK